MEEMGGNGWKEELGGVDGAKLGEDGARKSLGRLQLESCCMSLQCCIAGALCCIAASLRLHCCCIVCCIAIATAIDPRCGGGRAQAAAEKLAEEWGVSGDPDRPSRWTKDGAYLIEVAQLALCVSDFVSCTYQRTTEEGGWGVESLFCCK